MKIGTQLTIKCDYISSEQFVIALFEQLDPNDHELQIDDGEIVFETKNSKQIGYFSYNPKIKCGYLWEYEWTRDGWEYVPNLVQII